jgi:hypothetical protein
MLTVTTLELAKKPEPTQSVADMTNGRIVYASLGPLYAATEPWSSRPLPAQLAALGWTAFPAPVAVGADPS